MTWPAGIAAVLAVMALVLILTDQHRTRITPSTQTRTKPPDGEQT